MLHLMHTKKEIIEKIKISRFSIFSSEKVFTKFSKIKVANSMTMRNLWIF